MFESCSRCMSRCTPSHSVPFFSRSPTRIAIPLLLCPSYPLPPYPHSPPTRTTGRGAVSREPVLQRPRTVRQVRAAHSTHTPLGLCTSLRSHLGAPSHHPFHLSHLLPLSLVSPSLFLTPLSTLFSYSTLSPYLSDRWGHEFKKETVGLGFLPWAHIFGQTCELHTQVNTGGWVVGKGSGLWVCGGCEW